MIGTALAIGLALASAGGSAATNIYSSKKASETNDKSIAAQQAVDAKNAQLAEEQLAQTKKAHDDAVALDREHWNSYVQANTPSWQTGQRALASLADLAGVGGGGAPANATPAPVYGNQAPPTNVSRPAAMNPGASLLDLATANQAPTGGGAGVTLPASRAMPRMAAPQRSGGMSLADLAQMYSTNMGNPAPGVGTWSPRPQI